MKARLSNSLFNLANYNACIYSNSPSKFTKQISIPVSAVVNSIKQELPCLPNCMKRRMLHKNNYS